MNAVPYHKVIKQIKNSIDEERFLTSDSYRIFLQKIVRGISGDYSLKLIFSDDVATDGKVISVNPVHPYVMKVQGLAEKTLVILGQVAHELFHILYTDFDTLKTLKDKYKSSFEHWVVHRCLNIIEDAAIELAGTNYYTGSFRQAIIAANKNALDNLPSLDDMVIEGAPRLAVFLQACAMYCILGELKGKLSDSELLSLFKKAMPILDRGRIAPDTWGRLKAAEELFYIMRPLVEEAEKQNLQQAVQQIFVYTKRIDDEEKNNQPQSQPQSQPNIKLDFQEKQRQKTQKEIEEQLRQIKKKQQNSQEENDEEKEEEVEKREEGLGEESNEDFEEKPGEDCEKELEEESEKDFEDKEKLDNGDSDDCSGEKGSCGNSSNQGESDLINSQGDGKEESNEEDEEGNEEGELEEMLKRLNEQLDKVKDEIAKEEYDRQEQLKREKEIMEFARDVRYSDLHRNISVEVQVKFDIDDTIKEQYETEFLQIHNLTRNLIKNLKDIIRYNEDIKINGLYTGRVNRSQLSRIDKKIFYQRKEKAEEADLAILMLIDQSGSMSGDRIYYARLASMMMFEVCTNLGIPFAVIGHFAGWREDRVYHRHYMDFENPNDKYKLALIRAHDNTREGVSLKYAGEYLLQRPEQDKILIAISDGEPEHLSKSDIYEGEVAQKDTARVVKYLESKGIKVFGVAIGEGKSKIKEIYLHNYIDIPSINLLPVRLVNLIRRNLFK